MKNPGHIFPPLGPGRVNPIIIKNVTFHMLNLNELSSTQKMEMTSHMTTSMTNTSSPDNFTDPSNILPIYYDTVSKWLNVLVSPILLFVGT